MASRPTGFIHPTVPLAWTCQGPTPWKWGLDSLPLRFTLCGIISTEQSVANTAGPPMHCQRTSDPPTFEVRDYISTWQLEASTRFLEEGYLAYKLADLDLRQTSASRVLNTSKLATGTYLGTVDLTVATRSPRLWCSISTEVYRVTKMKSQKSVTSPLYRVKSRVRSQ